MKKIMSAWEDEDVEEGIYSEDTRADLLEDDEISLTEAAFMQGWDQAA